jgi:hypothetical protein
MNAAGQTWWYNFARRAMEGQTGPRARQTTPQAPRPGPHSASNTPAAASSAASVATHFAAWGNASSTAVKPWG